MPRKPKSPGRAARRQRELERVAQLQDDKLCSRCGLALVNKYQAPYRSYTCAVDGCRRGVDE